MKHTFGQTRNKRSKRFRDTYDKRIAESMRTLKLLRDAEWMVTVDWCQPAERVAIRERVDELLESEWAKKYLKGMTRS